MNIQLRGHKVLSVTTWLSVNEFIGQIDSPRGVTAAYGWSKGKSFSLYSVKEGHIQRLGTIKREALDVPLLP